jgi:hypothetical protein
MEIEAPTTLVLGVAFNAGVYFAGYVSLRKKVSKMEQSVKRLVTLVVARGCFTKHPECEVVKELAKMEDIPLPECNIYPQKTPSETSGSQLGKGESLDSPGIESPWYGLYE